MSNLPLRPLRGLAGLCLALLTATALLAPLPARAQDGRFVWQTAFGSAAERIFFPYMIRSRTGGYLVCATVRDTSVAYTDVASVIVKFDEQGRQVWRTWLPHGGALLLAENRSGQILVARGGSLEPPDTTAHMALLTPGGQVLWNYAQWASISSLRTGNDGSFVGTAYAGPHSPLNQVFKMDSVGADIWRVTLAPSSGGIEGGVNVMLPSGAGYFVLNITEFASSPVVYKAEIVRLSETGLEEYRKPTPARNFIPSSSDVAADGSLLFAHNYYSRTTPLADTLWSKKYPTRLGGVTGVCALPDGGALLLGLWYNNFNLDDDVSLAKVSPDGVIIRDTVLTRGGSYDQAQHAALDTAGNYVICGTTVIAGVDKIFLIKLRPWTETLGVAPAADAAPSAPYPNPATDFVRLRGAVRTGATATLRDALGRVVRTYLLDATAADTPLSLAGLQPGLYLLSVTDDAGVAARTWRVLKQ